jgi:hypothetical protein
VAPGRDDKILTAWTGLAIAAFAQAGWLLNEPRYTRAAAAAADFLLSALRDTSGRLLHCSKDGRARFTAYLDDYACLIDGLVELFQADGAPRWLAAGLELAARLQADFHDPEQRGYFFTASDGEALITRTKDVQDNATPSGNGMAASALLRLGRLTGRRDLEEEAVQTLTMLSGLMSQHPRAAGQALLALDFLLGPTQEIVVLDGPDRSQGDALVRVVAQRFLPNALLIRPAVGEPPAPLLATWLEGRGLLDGRATAYVCQQQSCQPPVNAPEALGQILDKFSRSGS